MLTRPDDTTPLHRYPASIIRRYIEYLMRLTYDNPVLMKDLVYIVGAANLALMASPWLLPALGLEMSVGLGTVLFGSGLAGTAFSFASGFAQHKLFGFPVKDDPAVFKPAQFSYETATAEMVINEDNMPRLQINSKSHYDAGYVEGYILAEAIRMNLKQTNFMYPLILAAMSMGLRDHLGEVLRTIPERFQREMQGKVSGYNAWLRQYYPRETELSYEYYLLLHLLPDFKNYHPFGENRIATILNSLRGALTAALPQMGCTTIAMRLGDYTFLTRVLDWPSYGVAGKYFLQIDRNIAGRKRTIDIGLPVLSGALTILNENGLLIEMNVANGEQVAHPRGMPAVFFNRHCAENAGDLNELNRMIADEKPLGAYHLTATNGIETQSFHFYQSESVRGENAIDILDRNKQSPQLLVVTNNGLRFEQSVPVRINHSDSNERRENIHQLFRHKQVHDKLTQSIAMQANGAQLSSQQLLALQEDICLRLARLALVNNCESVLCAMYVYHQDQLQQARAITDNLYAQSNKFEDFKQLHIPRPR